MWAATGRQKNSPNFCRWLLKQHTRMSEEYKTKLINHKDKTVWFDYITSFHYAIHYYPNVKTLVTNWKSSCNIYENLKSLLIKKCCKSERIIPATKWDTYVQFSERKEMQIVFKHLSICSTSLTINDMQIKYTVNLSNW